MLTADPTRVTSSLDLAALRIVGETGEIADDWGDNLLTGRENSGDGLVTWSELEVGRCKNFRPEWTSVGSPSATGGELVVDVDNSVGDQGVYVDVVIEVGTWEVEGRTENTGNNNYVGVRMIYQDADNQWKILERDDGSYGYLQKDDAGTTTTVIDSGGQIGDTNFHTLKATRDADANWEYFFDGVSQGTATDSFMPTKNSTRVQSRANDDVTSTHHYDNLKVY